MKTIKNLLLLTLVISFLSCSKNDDTSDSKFGNAPTGEIVPVEQRDLELTGFDSADRSTSNSQKWWRHIVSVVDFGSGCGDNEDEEYVYTDRYLGFTPDGSVYAKIGVNGTPIDTGETWEWTSSSKDKMIYQSVEFTLTELWSIRLTIASDQSQSGCSVVTWEEFCDC